jgi:hypothetical protein
MSTVPPREYEFNQEQNKVIGGLATRMRGVGFFLIVVAVVNFLVTVLVVVAIYRARLPQGYVDSVLEKVASQKTRTDVNAQLSKLPANDHLWGIAISSAVNGLIYLLIGVWTQSASRSFGKIVETQGSDISHLMNALSSLNKMYSLIYTLIVLTLLVFLVAVGLAIYSQVAR